VSYQSQDSTFNKRLEASGDFGLNNVAVYREQQHDGFIITAFLTRREASLKRRKQLWP
jgi:hypothetical protein